MATMARRSLDIWWTYSEEESHVRHIRTMNDYAHFFRADIQAHLVMAVVSLVSLFDSSNNTVTLKHIVHKAVEQGHDAMRPFRSTVDAYANDSRVSGLTLLRNKLFAHRDRDASYDDTFSQAQVRPFSMFELSDETFKIINAVADATGSQRAVHDTIVHEHTDKLLLKLRR